MRFPQMTHLRVGFLSAVLLLVASGSAIAESGPATRADGTLDFRSQIASARSDGAIVTPATLAEERPCDESVSKYTPETATGQGSGEGDDISEARLNAVWDAVTKAAYAQYSCAKCDDESDKTCEKFHSSISPESAVMSNPAKDCDYDRATQKWKCEGEVNFQLDDGPNPSANTGCKKCAT